MYFGSDALTKSLELLTAPGPTPMPPSILSSLLFLTSRLPWSAERSGRRLELERADERDGMERSLGIQARLFWGEAEGHQAAVALGVFDDDQTTHIMFIFLNNCNGL